LKEGVLKEKELEEARAVFAKHGFEVPEPVAKNSKSRTSSEMLFGEKYSSNKKRDTKRARKEDEMSMVSGKTSGSKNYNKKVMCDLCKKEMRSDALKYHRGGKFCKV
jgi:hypothetical protein